MQYIYGEYTHANGTNKYKITEGGTAYHIDTPDELVAILERLRASGTRIKLDYGDTSTGESWDEQFDITGTLGRSNGQFKVPLLIHNARSWGGGAILDHCIIAIYHANKREGGTIYESPARKQYIYDQTHFTEGISI